MGVLSTERVWDRRCGGRESPEAERKDPMLFCEVSRNGWGVRVSRTPRGKEGNRSQEATADPGRGEERVNGTVPLEKEEVDGLGTCSRERIGKTR